MIIFLGVLNVSLGLALSIYTGHGPPGFRETWEMFTGDLWATEEPVDEIAELAAVPLEQLLDTDVDDDFDDDMYDEMYDDDAVAVQDPDAPDDWNLDEKYVETSLLKLNIAMMKSGARATEIDSKLRACRGNTDRETILKCKTQLLDDCESYLVEQSEAAEKFSERINELGELSAMGEEIEMANLEQSAQIETTISNLSQMDLTSDLEGDNQRLLEEINNLRMARHKLRDNQEGAFLTIARYEDRMGAIEEQLQHDALTKLNNRIGMETTLWNWWKQGRQKSRQMSAVLFDVDGFGQINEDHGSLACDRILYHLAQTIHAQIGKADLAGRFTGQRFLVVMLDAGPRAAIKNAERIRQCIQKLVFISGEVEISVTVTGGLTEVLPDDTEESLHDRLEETLKVAKKAGPNRTFAHDGRDEIEEIESPDLRADVVEIPI